MNSTWSWCPYLFLYFAEFAFILLRIFASMFMSDLLVSVLVFGTRVILVSQIFFNSLLLFIFWKRFCSISTICTSNVWWNLLLSKVICCKLNAETQSFAAEKGFIYRVANVTWQYGLRHLYPYWFLAAYYMNY